MFHSGLGVLALRAGSVRGGHAGRRCRNAGGWAPGDAGYSCQAWSQSTLSMRKSENSDSPLPNAHGVFRGRTGFICADDILNMRHFVYVCMVIKYSKGKAQPGKAANPARSQFNRENESFPVPVRA